MKNDMYSTQNTNNKASFGEKYLAGVLPPDAGQRLGLDNRSFAALLRCPLPNNREGWKHIAKSFGVSAERLVKLAQ
ncbi:MAG: hypothetical protein HXX08_21380 [Chloroflexi bacterium]|uniref:Uncharacterized protein n=1 Tax=Candidatus Chlorohelix allophototropha TaxID=3003348 RepID=A0A8T7M8D2_9CHLR|nr:hypothetical protein [Chloroflexota bacterium]WJW68351.1 hypothetical protein OZ401_003960 [Chloroflexota bacterium L227-S17]